jgi:hypothetical protein
MILLNSGFYIAWLVGFLILDHPWVLILILGVLLPLYIALIVESPGLP